MKNWSISDYFLALLMGFLTCAVIFCFAMGLMTSQVTTQTKVVSGPKIGDIVQLRSGGPEMTVTYKNHNSIKVTFVNDQGIDSEWIHEDAVKTIETYQRIKFVPLP